ncbi:MAG: hypothetical protein KJ906_00240 [Nanoarchaeota archaeon]|nr:hypothetical protein [Nanoarchaeota archaeon]
MPETTKDIIKLLAEAILVLMIFAILFTQNGIIMGTYDYMQYAEPIILQDSIKVALTTANDAPGYFKIKIESSGKNHKLQIEKDLETDYYYLHIAPSQAAEMKTKFASAEPTELSLACEIEDLDIQLLDVKQIWIKKEITDTGCKIEVIA